MRSPLPELFGKLVLLYGGVGIAAAIFFHPGMLFCTGVCLYAILQFYIGLEQGTSKVQTKRKVRNYRSYKR